MENNNQNEEGGLLVIGVGLPRTGTWSTAHALATLLDCSVEKIHHGMQLTQQSESKLDFWIKALKGEVSNDKEWRTFFKDYKACLGKSPFSRDDVIWVWLEPFYTSLNSFVYAFHLLTIIDLPAILFYKELVRVFPHSKVILTQRDPQSWYMSWHNSIAKTLELIESAPYKWFLDLDKKVTLCSLAAAANF